MSLIHRCSARIAVALSILLAAFGGTAHAGIKVDPLIVDLVSSTGWRKDILVTNDSADETLYVQAKLKEVLKPGTAEEQHVELRTPEESGLLVSPVQLVLEPGQSKLVRVIAVTPPRDIDRVYRLELAPAVGDVVAQGTAIKLVVGYNLLIMAHPKGAAYELQGERQGSRLILRNTGKASVLAERIRSCTADMKSCTDLPVRRLYPGNEARMDLPQEGPALVRLNSEGAIKEVRF